MFPSNPLLIPLIASAAAASSPQSPPSHFGPYQHHHHNNNDDLLGTFDWGTLRCSSPSNINETLPTPTYGFTNRAWMMCSELTIQAPPYFVYDALVDFNSYPKWNTFVAKVYGYPSNVTTTPDDIYVGMPMNFTVAGLLGDADPTVSESEEIVTVLQDVPKAESHFLMNAWRSDKKVEGLSVTAEHPNILTPVIAARGAGVIEGEVWTRYLSYETYYDNPLSTSIRAQQDRLQVLFDRQGAQLKEYVEDAWRAL